MRQLISKIVPNFVRRFAVKSAAAKAAPKSAIEAVENLEERRLFASSLAYGINANAITSSNYGSIVKMLNDTGTKTVRIWLNLSSWSTRSEAGIFKYIRKFSNDGFDTTVTVDPPKSASSDSAVTNAFKWLADDLGDYVDRWQVGNEVDKEFSSLKNYVNDILKPAAAGLHAKGEKVISGSVSWDPEDVKTMVGYGMLNYVDMVGYHPYVKSVDQLKEVTAEVKDLANGKPIVATEWNVRGSEGDKSAWAEEIKDFWPTIRDNYYAAYYFAAVKVSTLAGPAAVLTSGGGQNGAFYTTYKSLKSNTSGGGSVTGSTSGSTASTSATKPSVVSYTIYDSAGKAISGYTNITSDTTVDLSKLGNRYIQIKASASSNTSSVKFAFTGRSTRTENTAPWEVFGSGSTAANWYASAGTYTLTATPYTSDNAAGTAGAAKTIKLTFKTSTTTSSSAVEGNTASSTATKPSVAGFSIVDGSGNVLGSYSNITGDITISLSSLKTRNIQIKASASSNTSSIKFGFTGRSTRTENTAPWTVFGDSKNAATTWYATKGTYTLSATAYTADNAAGTASATKSIIIKFV
ncbi:MAG: hypothetical protein QM754_20540 [Tepidisphaeraceae bacterium]